MSSATSPRLPGIPLLQPHCTGPEYSRWRRSLKFVLETRNLWKYCNGKCPMPMPEAGPHTAPPTASTINLQNSLLDERRAWVKQDREVKLDIFLSMVEETMHEVFGLGPPLPPLNLNAEQMLRTLDRRYGVFKFEAYHHAFCHFLNMHVDQYGSIQDFNSDFATTLEDLVDHGQALSNTQACSAYLSKLRCTQNPWVVEMLGEWDVHHRDIGVLDLIKESPQWFLFRPLARKTSPILCIDTAPDKNPDVREDADSDVQSMPSSKSMEFSLSLHSRQGSDTTVQSVESQDLAFKRHTSEESIDYPKITTNASDGRSTIGISTRCEHSDDVPPPSTIKYDSVKFQDTIELLGGRDQPGHSSENTVITRHALLSAPYDRPLPEIPTEARRIERTYLRARASSPSPMPPTQHESANVSLHPSTPLSSIHPALRGTPLPRKREPLPSLGRISHPPPLDTNVHTIQCSNIAIPWPSTPDLPPQLSPSSAEWPITQMPTLPPSYMAEASEIFTSISPPEDQPVVHTTAERPSPTGYKEIQERKHSITSSTLSLPLQGTRDSAWTYLYEAKGGYLLQSPPRERSVSPLQPDSEQLEVYTHRCKPPTYGKLVVVSDPDAVSMQLRARSSNYHLKSSSLDFVARLSGETGFGGGQKSGQWKKKSWSLGAGIGRFNANRGVKEII